MQFRKLLKWSFCAVFSVFLTNTFAQSSNENTLPVAKNVATGSFFSLLGIPPYIGGFAAGYQLTPHFGLQAGIEGIWGSTIGFDLDTAAIYDIAMRGVLPIGSRTELFGKLGFGVIHGETSVTFPYLGTTNQISESVGPTFGLGLGFCFTPRWMLAAQIDGIYSTGSQVLRSGFKGLPAVSLTYHFAA